MICEKCGSKMVRVMFLTTLDKQVFEWKCLKCDNMIGE